jgi:hypothetical protein
MGGSRSAEGDRVSTKHSESLTRQSERRGLLDAPESGFLFVYPRLPSEITNKRIFCRFNRSLRSALKHQN